MDDEEIAEIIKQAGEVYSLEGLEFEVVAKIRVTRMEDGATIDTLMGPILLYEGPSLYRAMFIMGTACQVLEYKPDPGEIGPAAQDTINDLRADKFKWQKPKESK